MLKYAKIVLDTPHEMILKKKLPKNSLIIERLHEEC